MNINDIKEKNGIYFYKANSATIKIKFKFLINNQKETLFQTLILSHYLKRTNKKYKTLKDINNKKQDLYNLEININHNFIGNKNFFNFTITLLNPKMIEEDYLEEAISFAKEILFNPNFNNDKLDKEIFIQIKKDVISSIKSELSNPKILNNNIFLKTIFKNTNIDKNITTDISEITKIINNITDIDIINFYKETINNNSFFKGYIFGDLNEQEYELIINSFPFKSNYNKVDYCETQEVPVSYEEKIDKNIKDSTLTVVYQINNYSFDKFYLYKTISLLLSGTNGIIFKILREELGLVYSAGAFINKYYYWGVLYIQANINYENKEKCLKGIDEIFIRLKNKKIVNELLKYAKDKLNEELLCIDDSVEDLINELENYVFSKRPTLNEIIQKVNKIKAEDIINEIDNIQKK